MQFRKVYVNTLHITLFVNHGNNVSINVDVWMMSPRVVPSTTSSNEMEWSINELVFVVPLRRPVGTCLNC